MSRRGVNASLEEQMARLHDNMSARDKRRTQQHDMRQSGKEDDPYEQDRKRLAGKGRPGVGQDINASAAARAAVASASAIEGPRMITCDVCGVSFAKESGMQQHLEGPTHRKALERQRKEELRLQQLGNNRWAAENAAGAAAWQQLDKKYSPAQRAPLAEAPAADASPPRPVSAQLAAAGPGRGPARPPPPRPQRKPTAAELAAAAAAERVRAAHSQAVAAATLDDGPLTIGGWVPPSVPVAVPHLDAGAGEDPAEAGADVAAAEEQQIAAHSAEAAGDGTDGVTLGNAPPGSGSDDSDDGSSGSDSSAGDAEHGHDDETPQSFF